MLNDGQVLIAGGYDGGNVSRVTETYDPTAGTFAQSGNLNTGRSGHTATLLSNGEVLVCGGDEVSGAALTSAELYAPAVLTPPNLVSIALTPANFTIFAGVVQQFTATGTFADSHTETLQSVVWTSSDTRFATVSNDSGNRGRARGVGTGVATINACAASICGSTALTVQPAALVSIAVTPANQQIAGGGTQQFAATGIYTDGGTLNLSGAAWTSSDTSVAFVSATGLASGSNQGTTTITASIGLISGSTNLTVIWGFTTTGSMSAGRYAATATLLDDGTELVAGGGVSDGGAAVSSAEIYHPATSLFTSTAGSMSTGRYHHKATLLNDGRVLLTGGTSDGGTALSSAEIYDSATGTFTPTGSMSTERLGHAAVLLNDGRVLVVGGAITNGTVVSSADIYDPATGTFTPTGSLSTGRSSPTATLLNDGRVLVAGGSNASGFPLTAEIYDPAKGSFALTTGSINTGRTAHTATLLNNGQVLIAGGSDGQGLLSSAEIYDPGTEQFTTTGSLNTVHFNGTATMLNDGQVLIAGGYDGGNVSRVTETYDPTAGTFAQSGNLNTGRSGHTATLLSNGEVLVCGGDEVSGAALTSAELYAPAVLTPPNLVSITVTPSNPTIIVGVTQRFIATGTFSDGSTQQQLASVTWSSTDMSGTNVAPVSTDATNPGVGLGQSLGTATIKACAGTICGSATLTVGVPTYSQLQPSLSPGQRCCMGMVFDPASNSTLLFGSNGDTWTWSPSLWTQLFPGTSPPGRSGAGMAYDRQLIQRYCSAEPGNSQWV